VTWLVYVGSAFSLILYLAAWAFFSVLLFSKVKRKVLWAVIAFALLYILGCMLMRPLPYVADAVVTSLWLTPWGLLFFFLFSRIRRKVLWAILAFASSIFVAGLFYQLPPSSSWESTVETIAKLGSYAEEYRNARGRAPDSMGDLLSHLKEQSAWTWRLTTDGWGRNIVLTKKGAAVELRSRGRDGKLGTRDDIVQVFFRHQGQRRGDQ